MIELSAHAEGVILPLQVKAAGRANRVGGEHAGALRVQVTQAPEKGKANAAVLALLSKTLGIPKARLEILSGETSPKKKVLVQGVALEQLQRQLEAALD